MCSHLCPSYAATCTHQMQPLVPIICSHLCQSNAASCARQMQPLVQSNAATCAHQMQPLVPIKCSLARLKRRLRLLCPLGLSSGFQEPLCPSNAATVPINCSHCAQQTQPLCPSYAATRAYHMQPLVLFKCSHLWPSYAAICARHMQRLVPIKCSHLCPVYAATCAHQMQPGSAVTSLTSPHSRAGGTYR
ncbi:hypothetical protein AB205_0115770 [Aquarana catesbeiana]|uniref:Uncharacterized protein n=1 Tax=Aquarana catesbeiana TaxID=8400 RepID=A0A2G9Q0I0_AQUCT|nr:hypothetical protein AB205_0115770 [Aquarana catesbeiana]